MIFLRLPDNYTEGVSNTYAWKRMDGQCYRSYPQIYIIKFDPDLRGIIAS